MKEIGIDEVLNNSPILIFALDSSAKITLIEGKEMTKLGIIKEDCIGQIAYKINNIPIKKQHYSKCMDGLTFSTIHIRYAPARNHLGVLIHHIS